MYRLPLIRVARTIEIRNLSPQEADLLQAEPGKAAFFADWLTYTVDESGERLAVWYQAIYRDDDYQFHPEFQVSL